jgi:hypothetical protein
MAGERTADIVVGSTADLQPLDIADKRPGP